jgi:hypothetical protein
MQCWKCGTDLNDLPKGRLPFRAICDKCFSWLHCCRNCTNYKPGMPNDCLVPGTEFVADREGANFCEEFQFLGVFVSKTSGVDVAAKKLFGDTPKLTENNPDHNPKKKFEDLFQE